MKNQKHTDNDMWQSVLQRDPAADHAFIYGVLSTGIFCRPTCPARRPKRENVRYFANAAEAQAAGLRACRRCKPLSASSQQQQTQAVKHACEQLANDTEDKSLDELAKHAGLSASHFQRLFKRIVGITPKQYEMACRKKRFRELLQADGRVTDAIYNAGYNSSGVAYANTSETLGMTPARYQNGALNLAIRYALTKTKLGWLLVAVTKKGVCAIEFGDSKAQLKITIKKQFAKAHLLEDQKTLRPLTQIIAGFVDHPTDGLDLPLDIKGTAFQHQVWQALRDIPFGELRSYSDVAQAIGKPRAVRAVASACANNSLALAIPCHRVMRSDGSLGGYRWGLERKQALIDQESE